MAEKENEHVIHYTVNDEPQSTTAKELTPVQILTSAGIDPATNYLVEIRGKEKESFKDKPNEPIKMHENMKFISVSTGPKPVSSTNA
jgi:hypothetical protein